MNVSVREEIWEVGLLVGSSMERKLGTESLLVALSIGEEMVATDSKLLGLSMDRELCAESSQEDSPLLGEEMSEVCLLAGS